MNPKISRLLFFFLLTFHLHGYSQGIGLVLSGGGASGFAHIGVIKALEENNIPINYITGTSSGALVGAMYACGYSASEIEAYVLSNEFQLMASGKVGRGREFFLREDDISSSILEFSFSGDSIIKKSLPTNFVRPALLDYEMMRIMGHPDAATGHDFDKLFVPFRCVASDIVAKKSMVFKDGYLNEAVRASMTFPFFVNPIRINGVLYFDGGLYNNFPADVMYRNFSPDFIIGSNVSYNAGLPTEDDVISQIENMLVSYSNFSLPCEDGILISPQTSVTTFEFSDVKTAIEDGYRATIEKMDSIKAAVPDRISTEELAERRRQFKSKIPALRISDVNTRNRKGLDQSYVRRSIFKKSKDEILSEARLERRYFRTYATPQLQYLFPKLDMRPDSTFKMDVNVKKSKPFRVDIGGIVSSRAINTGFAQLNYFHLGKVGTTAKANVYFGKFYSSGKGQIDIHLPSYYPVSFSVYGTHNNFDYFRNFATFSAVDRPSFLVQTEDYFGGQFKQPIFNNSKSTIDFRKVWLRDRYYQTENFTNIDTADVTKFAGNVFSWTIEQNSLNRKQYASEGTYMMFRGRFVDGFENSLSGSTAVEKYDIRKYHSWLSFSGEVRTFPFPFKHFKLGIHALANITSQPLFRNYSATILSMPAFQPIPDMQTYFFPEYRSPQYFGAGLNVIFTFWKNFDLRFDGYIYQPFIQVITNDEDNTFGYSKPFKGDAQVAAISGIYHSPIGPVRASINYFPMQKNPVNFQFTYGYILFNERAIR